MLTHLRIESQGDHRHRPDPGQVEAGKVFTGEGHGGAWEDEKETLAAIIEAINERFGLDLDDRDRLEGEKLKLTLLQDPELETFARQNSMEHYSLGVHQQVEGCDPRARRSGTSASTTCCSPTPSWPSCSRPPLCRRPTKLSGERTKSDSPKWSCGSPYPAGRNWLIVAWSV